MNGNDIERLLEASLRRRLASSEEAQLSSYFATHPEARTDWEADNQLNSLLKQLPDAPLSSNFTARVLSRVDLEILQAQRKSLWYRWRLFDIPGPHKWTFAALALSLAGAVTFQVHENFSRQELARSTATVSSIASLPTLEVLQNFEVIQRLGQVPQQEVDIELLAALQ